MTPDALSAFLAAQGLWLMGPIAVVEGPVVTLVAGALAAQGTLPLAGVLAVATSADLVGDAALWLAGRFLSHRLPRRLHRRIVRTLPPRTLRRHAGRILVFGKLTHSLGAPVLLAAGMARVPFLPFLGINLLATIPKVAALAALGWAFGKTFATGHGWLAAGPALLFALALATGLLWLRAIGKRPCPSAV